ncbi:Nlp family transcriptional regulator [Breoghania corrubedonensis]|uniref:Nlp family transcriptional regulator n=1 Tax=Breoghania corrubedonensis TaxID=665038 RepID=A0A2T5VCC1_9HYPH|nr:Nlp family transcriptional regulator [Breoghania corrubedonensis]
MPRVWDRHAIAAEIRRRGSNLTQLARDAGEPDCTCRQAMSRCYRKGEWIIANFLGVHPSELWPERYAKAPTGRDTNAKRDKHQSQNERSTTDTRCAA